MSRFILGLTGGIGSGKSAASDYIAEQGIAIVDADVIAREVVAPGTEGLKEIKAHFGPEVIDESGALIRSQLRQRVFDNPDEKHGLISYCIRSFVNKSWLSLSRHNLLMLY